MEHVPGRPADDQGYPVRPWRPRSASAESRSRRAVSDHGESAKCPMSKTPPTGEGRDYKCKTHSRPLLIRLCDDEACVLHALDLHLRELATTTIAAYRAKDLVRHAERRDSGG